MGWEKVLKISSDKLVFFSGMGNVNMVLWAITRLVHVSLNTPSVAHPSSSMDGIHGWGAKSPRNVVICTEIFARKLQDSRNAMRRGVSAFTPEAFCD